MDNTITPLCKLGLQYGTDKCPQIKHSYTPFYYNLLKNKRESVKKVLEMGIGRYSGMQENETFYDPGLKRHYHRGASLYMWRDFFPNAEIYGADINPETIFEDERLKIYLCDERKKADLIQLIKKTGSDIDVFIDDGSHHVDDQIFLAKTILPLLSNDVTYIIEDVIYSNKICTELSAYDCDVPDIPSKSHDGKLVVVKNKKNGT
jgi:hypothetical protein